jgi:hypothetical protein
MTLSSILYSTLNVPPGHLLPDHRPQLDFSLPPEDDPKFLACCVLSENLPLETNKQAILNGPTSRNPVELHKVSGGQAVVHLYLFTE